MRAVEQPTRGTAPTTSDAHVPEMDPLATYHRQEIPLDQVALFWERFNAVAEIEDKNFARDNKLTFDTLSIFAILFAAIDTAFILESLHVIQLDRVEKANDMIQLVIQQIRDGLPANEALLLDDAFDTGFQTSRSNALFFLSLCCALIAASTAIMGKQWLKYYEREGVRIHSTTKAPLPSRARQRQTLYEGRAKRNLDCVIQTLPTIIQLSLFLFFVALMDFVMPRHVGLALIVMGFSVASLLIYIFTTILGFMNPCSPYQTQASLLASKVWKAIHHPSFPRSFNHLHTYPVQRWPAILVSQAFVLLQPQQPLLIQDSSGSPPNQPTDGSSPPNLPDQHRSRIDNNDLLNLTCLIFFMKKAKTSHDTAVLMAALDSLPKDLDVDSEEPIVATLGEVMVQFLLRPRLSSQNKIEWGNSWIDFRQMLKLLHLLYVRADYLHNNLSLIASSRFSRTQRKPFVQQFELTIQSEMWAVFSRDPLNIDSVTLIAEIMESSAAPACSPPTQPSTFQDTTATPCSETDLELLLGCLKSRPTDRADYLPYLKLFAHDAWSRGPVSSLFQSGYGGEAEYALMSSMWIGGKPDLDLRRGWLRLTLLPPLRLRTNTLQLPFSRYALHWLRTQILSPSQGSSAYDPDQHQCRKLWEGEVSRVFACYALAICTLSASESWVSQFEQDQHPAFLTGLIHGFHHHPRVRKGVGDADSLPNPHSGRGTALLTFMTLWHARWTAATLRAKEQELYVNIGSITAIINFLKTGGDKQCELYTVFLEEFELMDIGKDRLYDMMDHLATFLEEASRGPWLKAGDVVQVLDGFKLLGERVFKTCVPLGAKQGLATKSLENGLYKRVEKLAMLLE